jgi:hypothetical protein
MIPIYLCFLCYKKLSQDESILTVDLKSPKIRAYLIFSILETIIGYVAVLPSLYFSPVFLILFGQSSIILNHIGSFFYFKRTYSQSQIFSVLVILFAVVLATITESGKYTISTTTNTINTTGNEDEVEEYANSTVTNTSFDVKTIIPVDESAFDIKVYMVLFLMAVFVRLVSAFSSLYKEQKYKELSLNPIETLTWVSVLEVPMSLFIFVFLFLPLPPPAIHVPFNQLGEYIKNGSVLLFFSEDKEMFWIMVIFLVLSAVSSNIDFIVTQKLNSTINVITGVATLSLSILFVGIEIIAGVAYRKVTFYEYMALILIIMAIINYRIGTQEEEKKMLDVNGVEVYASHMQRRLGQYDIPINNMVPPIVYETDDEEDEDMFLLKTSDDDVNNKFTSTDQTRRPNNVNNIKLGDE